jgi:hypothetical protein
VSSQTLSSVRKAIGIALWVLWTNSDKNF